VCGQVPPKAPPVAPRGYARDGAWRVFWTRLSHRRLEAPELCSVFTEDMYRSRVAEASEFYVDTEPGATVIAHEYVAPSRVIAERLEILGFTSGAVQRTLNEHLDEARMNAHQPRPPWYDSSPERMAWDDVQRHHLVDYTAQEWIADMRSAVDALAGVPTADDLDEEARYFVDGTLLPRWSRANAA
jgi:hypothetical protein